MAEAQADHGGGIDAAARRFGGARADWLDLSTGINPNPFPLPALPSDAWTALPDQTALDRLIAAARQVWSVPDGAAVLAVSGASAPIALVPHLRSAGRVHIPGPTYNEHARAFRAAGWEVVDTGATAQVLVHPNNPDGRFHAAPGALPLTVIDESFCDIAPDRSLIHLATRPGTLVLKSFGKFWGLAGLRLGFAIGDPELIGALSQRLGPWPVSGPALEIGAAALEDTEWAETTRLRLLRDAARLDALVRAPLVGGTPLFRLYEVDDAARWQEALAERQIWSRIFPYSRRWLRLGLPPATGWDRLAAALQGLHA